jgi:hypothetical protein
MIVWATGGLIVGWFLSTRLGVGSLGAFLISATVVPLAIFAALHRFDADALVGFAVFWVAVQGAYLVANLVEDRRAAPVGDGRGDRPSPERA